MYCFSQPWSFLDGRYSVFVASSKSWGFSSFGDKKIRQIDVPGKPSLTSLPPVPNESSCCSSHGHIELPRPPIEDSLCSVRAAIGFPEPGQPQLVATSPPSPLRPFYRGRHGRRFRSSATPPPLAVPPPIGIPVHVSPEAANDPSGAGAHAEAVYPPLYTPLVNCKYASNFRSTVQQAKAP